MLRDKIAIKEGDRVVVREMRKSVEISLLPLQRGKRNNDIGVYLHNRIQTEDLLGCLHQLKDDGFIEIISESGPLLHVRPTHKGRHYKEYRRAAVIGFFMKSIFTPIIVAFVTTLITITLERLFR